MRAARKRLDDIWRGTEDANERLRLGGRVASVRAGDDGDVGAAGLEVASWDVGGHGDVFFVLTRVRVIRGGTFCNVPQTKAFTGNANSKFYVFSTQILTMTTKY